MVRYVGYVIFYRPKKEVENLGLNELLSNLERRVPKNDYGAKLKLISMVKKKYQRIDQINTVKTDIILWQLQLIVKSAQKQQKYKINLSFYSTWGI